MLCRDLARTGDSIVSALRVLAEVMETGRTLRGLADGMEKLPQRMINVPVEGVVDLDGNEAIRRATAEAEDELGRGGRVILRPSGTEPVVRVTVEGSDVARVDRVARHLADVVTEAARTTVAD
jgi:phosphoglucosamine mutase